MNDVLQGDVLELLRGVRPHTVQTVITSPPCWGLRDYRVPGQIGLERDPRDYIAKLVEVFREVRRVLRRDGTLWLNMGDSYTDGGRGDDTGSTLLGTRQNQAESRKASNRTNARPFGLGGKQLIGMPWRLAFALQDDGWVLRDDIVWEKPNPMPESTKDRPTRAHEYVFLFSVSRHYYYDAAAIAEPVSGTAHHRGTDGVGRKARVPSGWASGVDRSHTELVGRYAGDRALPPEERPHSRQRLRQGKQNESFLSAMKGLVPMRNKRDVWRIRPEPYKGAHFATFPTVLVRNCILAGSAARACELCGAPWRPTYGESKPAPAGTQRRQAHAVPWFPSARERTGSAATCTCTLARGSARSLVLDPFGRRRHSGPRGGHSRARRAAPRAECGIRGDDSRTPARARGCTRLLVALVRSIHAIEGYPVCPRLTQISQQEFMCVTAIVHAREAHNAGDSRLWFQFEEHAKTSGDALPDVCLRYIIRCGCMPYPNI